MSDEQIEVEEPLLKSDEKTHQPEQFDAQFFVHEDDYDDLDVRTNESTEERESYLSKKFFIHSFILLMISILGIGPYFAYDSIAALAQDLEKQLHIHSNRLGLLFSAYSLPNLILLFFGGIFIDKYGTTPSTILFGIGLVFGCSMIAKFDELGPIIVGRMIVGASAEGLGICKGTFLTRWFSGHHLNFAFGFVGAIAESGDSLGFLILPMISQRFGLDAALWFTAGFCGFTSLIGILLAFFDRWKRPNKKKYEEESSSGFDMKKLKNLPFQYWLLVGVIFFGQTALYSFLSLGGLFLQKQYGYAEDEAGRIMGMFGVGQLGAPLIGFGMDRIPRARFPILSIGCLSYCFCFLLFAFTQFNPIPIIAAVVICYAFCEVIVWAGVGSYVQDNSVGTAFAIAGMSYNLGLVVLPPLFGYLQVKTGSFHMTSLVTALLFGCAFLISLPLNFQEWIWSKKPKMQN